ncbi:hypothetical protein GCK72_005985 [Caenorhabditis remanei]|uniref:Uncharacterized protein n=1 Tax=Caenorhabditis remanei TaxID=31234 RepID=A0A6A5HE17_CAERE|nr:hypothetical protein GCK72_005985 [Caenorhabditis remanei]KAF1766030.1 hypothetical protein GCK72_005985 [Caenorhabditis remanei]
MLKEVNRRDKHIGASDQKKEKKLSTTRITISSFGSTSCCSVDITIIWENTPSTLRRSSSGYKPSCLRSSTGECSQSVKALRKSSTIVCSFAPDDLNTSYSDSKKTAIKSSRKSAPDDQTAEQEDNKEVVRPTTPEVKRDNFVLQKQPQQNTRGIKTNVLKKQQAQKFKRSRTTMYQLQKTSYNEMLKSQRKDQSTIHSNVSRFRLNNVICNCQQLLKTAGRYFY